MTRILTLFVCINIFTAMASAKDSCAPRFESVIVNGDSMSPLLKNQQELQLDLNYYSCHTIQAGDLVVFEIPGRKNRIIKKIFAVPGDTYKYRNNQIEINGKILKNSAGENYNIQSKMLELYASSYPVLPKDSYLVLGDQPRGSFDASRMGFIDRQQIVGKVQLTKKKSNK